jgi:hypothetical protein
VSFDGSGNAGVAWHDTRDGVFEIYFTVITSTLPDGQRCSTGNVSPGDTRIVNLGCAATGDQDTVFTLSSRCSQSVP